MSEIHLGVFKECDLRGEFPAEITQALAYKFGRAIGTLATDPKVVIGGDFRASTPSLMASLLRGLLESGCHVYDLGQLSTPAYYFAKRHLGIAAGVMVTASHSPAAWNGFKPTLGDTPITPQELERIKKLVVEDKFVTGHGASEKTAIKKAYVNWLAERFAGLGQKLNSIIFDCGGGATAWVMRDVIEALHLPAQVLFGEPDATFSGRSPDIAGKDDLAALQKAVQQQQSQIGFGFDGDGDRVGVVDEHGRRVTSDQLIGWLAEQLLQHEGGGAVVYDLKLSRLVAETVERLGGQALPQKSGHTFIKTAMLQHNAIFGGEYSGHLFYRELGGGDDGLFSALLVASLLAETGLPLSQAISHLPHYVSTPDIRIRYVGEKSAMIEKAAEYAQADGAKLIRLDGVKAEYPEGWALMRASVTEPAFTFRFEGSTHEAMIAVARRFLAGVDELGETVLAQVIN